MIDDSTLKLFDTVLNILILPALYWGWEVRRDLKDGHNERESLKQLIKSTQDQNSREHGNVILALKETQELIRISEKDNRSEHKQLSDTIHEIDKNNTREHAILANGGKL